MNAEIFSSQVRKVLEDGALLFADPAEGEPEPGGMRFQLRFEGEARGRVHIACDRGIGEQIARNLLGIEDGQPCEEELVESSLREILNILGGTVLADLGDPGTIRMHTPEPDDGMPAEGRTLASSWSVDGMPVTIHLEWRT